MCLMKIIKLLTRASILFALILTLSNPVYAGTEEAYCVSGNPASGVKTAIGCVPVDFFGTGPSGNSFVGALIRVSIGLGSGFALIMMLYGTFTIISSAGSPDKLKLGQEIITSAVMGLIFIVLSTVLMNFIGINILGLPGLN